MATIIKTHEPQRPSGTAMRAVAYDLTDMSAQADSYLVTVRNQAAQIVEQAKREADAVRKDAETAGRRAAEQAIERILDEKVAQQMKTLTPALQAAVQQVEDAKQEWLRRWESSAVDLAVAIAGRLVRGEIQRRPEIKAAWIRESLQLAAGAADVTVSLNPADHETLSRQVEQLAKVFTPLAKLNVVADDAITPGGCKLVTEFGSVDQQLETQLERVKEELS
jgi:flagellar assembly protein FliH